MPPSQKLFRDAPPPVWSGRVPHAVPFTREDVTILASCLLVCTWVLSLISLLLDLSFLIFEMDFFFKVHWGNDSVKYLVSSRPVKDPAWKNKGNFPWGTTVELDLCTYVHKCGHKNTNRLFGEFFTMWQVFFREELPLFQSLLSQLF